MPVLRARLFSPPAARPRRSRARLATAAALLTACALAAPAAAAPEPSEPGAAPGVVENLGVPISTYLILDSVLAEDAQGRPTLYGSTYNAPSDAVTFFGVDPVTGDVRTQLPMPGAWGGYHVTASPDGRIYLGPLNSSSAAQVWEYDPVADSVAHVATMPTGIMCFGITVSPFTGKVYCGTHSGGGVYEYDPATGAVRHVTSTLTYPKGLVVLDEDRLVVAQGTEASVVVVDIATGAQQEVLPAEYAGYSFAYNAVQLGDYVYVQLVTPDQQIIRFDAATMTFAGEPPGVSGMSLAAQEGAAGEAGGIYAVGPADGTTGTLYAVDGQTLERTDTGVAPTWMAGVRLWPVTVDGERWLTSVGSSGILGRWNPVTGEVWTHQLSLPGAPTTITAAALGPDGHVYGGTYETNALFGHDPDTGETAVLGNVAPGRTGEILSMTTAGDKLFLGSYISNVVTVYDPSEPWQPGSTPGSNPLDLGPVGEDQYRPWDMLVGPDGRVWVASSGAYGELSGALTAIDPQTYEVQSFRGLAGAQHLFSLAAGDEVLYAGTTRYGDDTDAGGDAQLLTVDPDTGTVLSAVIPVAGATRITALETASDGTLYGAADGIWFRLDPGTGAPTVLGGFPYGPLLDLTRGPDGSVYGTTGSALVRIDPATDELTLVATPGSSFYRTLAFADDGRAYWGSGPSLLRVLPDVDPAVTTTTATAPARPARHGQPTEVTVTVAGPDGAPSQPGGSGGTVELRRAGDDEVVAEAELGDDGTAVVLLTPTDLGRPGRHTVYAAYTGSQVHAASESTPVRIVVRP